MGVTAPHWYFQISPLHLAFADLSLIFFCRSGFKENQRSGRTRLLPLFVSLLSPSSSQTDVTTSCDNSATNVSLHPQSAPPLTPYTFGCTRTNLKEDDAIDDKRCTQRGVMTSVDFSLHSWFVLLYLVRAWLEILKCLYKSRQLSPRKPHHPRYFLVSSLQTRPLIFSSVVIPSLLTWADLVMHKSFHHKTSLDDLPVEIILEVASHLDLEDIHSLQQVSFRSLITTGADRTHRQTRNYASQ